MSILLTWLVLLLCFHCITCINIFGFDFQSSFFSDEYVGHQVFIGNVTEDYTYLVDQEDPLKYFNTSGSELFLPLNFPMNTPAHTVEVVLSVDLFPELLQLCIWKDHKGVQITNLESSRIEVCKTCSDFFDECLLQMHMRYNKRPPHIADGYNFRMVARLDEAAGQWMVRLTRKLLPHHAVISIHMAVTTKEYELEMVAWGGVALFLAVGCSVVLLAAAVLTFCRHPELLVADSNQPGGEQQERTIRSSLENIQRRLASWFARRRAERYAQMEADGVTEVEIIPQTSSAAPTAAGIPGEAQATDAASASSSIAVTNPVYLQPPPTSPAVVGTPTAQPSSASSTSCTEAAASRGPPPPLMQQLLSRGLIQPPSAPPAEEEEEENFCRICRCAEPEADLFSPCNCDGSMKFVHRACLAEWREKTTNPVNRQYCSECKTPFRIVVHDAAFRFVVDSMTLALKVAAPLLVLEGILVVTGYAFKAVAGVLQGNIGMVDWDPNLYHHFLGTQVVAVYMVHYRVLTSALQSSVGTLCLFSLTIVSLFLEVLTGYMAHFVLWCFGSMLWDWQVYYLSGCMVVALYAFYLHDSVMAAYHRWSVQHRSEVVLDRNQAI